MRFESVVMGLSSGGVELLLRLLPLLPAEFPLPVMVCLHIGHDAESLAELLDARCALHVKEAEAMEIPRAGTVYLAPSGYHLLMEADRSFSLSADPVVKFARPSIDVLFESAADTYGRGVIGVILTGASDDGAAGLARIRARGGYAIVQTPQTANSALMPEAALRVAGADRTITPPELIPLLLQLIQPEND